MKGALVSIPVGVLTGLGVGVLTKNRTAGVLASLPAGGLTYAYVVKPEWFGRPTKAEVKGLSVGKSKGGTVDVDMKLKNTGNRKHKFYCGCAIRHNDGTHVVNLHHKTVTIPADETGKVHWSTDTGCLAPTSGGPSKGETILDKSGIYYDLIAKVYGGAKSNPDMCWDTELTNFLAGTGWQTKVIDTITIDASINWVKVNGTEVYS